MLWRQTGNDSNDTAIIKLNCVYKVHTPMHTIKMLGDKGIEGIDT